ncbi:Taf-13 [Aphelenchoides fujianensis]|nr:Taf-13 [Aphelenchoides fujianensis]
MDERAQQEPPSNGNEVESSKLTDSLMISADAELFEAEDAGGKTAFGAPLAAMLFGFGDSKEPREDTIECLEKIVLTYIEELSKKAAANGRPERIGLDDLYYFTRRDHKKFARVKELLSMNAELKQARKSVDSLE